MEENENFGLEEFESALFDDGYQIDDDTDTEETETAEAEETDQETDSDDEDDAEGDETEEDEHTSESQESGANASEKPESGGTDQTFTLKVNKEERKVTLEEMTALAQKGADYDRVEEQNQKNQQTIQDLQTRLNGQQGVLDVLGIIAKESGSSLEQLAETLYVNFRKSAGASEDVARGELKNAKLEKELNAFKAQETRKQEQENDAASRAQRDLQEFRKDYPEVELSDELLDKLVPDVQRGMSLAGAYRKYEKAQDSARIAELERKLAAKDQNDKNKRRSPGSQQDSGGRRTKSDYDEFEKALFG